MKLETILNAFQFAHTQYINLGILDRLDPLNLSYYVLLQRRERQCTAFRARILRMDAEKDARIVELLQLQTKEALLRVGDYWFNRPQAKRELR